MKKKQSTTGDEESRYAGTVLGKEAELRSVKIEGSDLTSLEEWKESIQRSRAGTVYSDTSGRQSSALSSLGDASIESMEL